MTSTWIAPTPWTPNAYPKARRGDHVDVYKSKNHGEVRVHDPYQWLEENSEETTAWVEAQAAFTQEYLQKNPELERLKKEMFKNIDYPKFSAPNLKGDKRWYWYYNSGLQAQTVIYRSINEELPDFSQGQDGPGGEIFFDPNILTDDGTAAIASAAFSKSGQYYAYGISLSGSDFFTIYVRKTSVPFAPVDGKRPLKDEGQLEDVIRYAKFSSIVWTHDNAGFFYQRFPARAAHGVVGSDAAGTETDKDLNAMLYYHRIGTPQSEDVLVMKDEANPTWMWAAGVSDPDGRYLTLNISRDTARKSLFWIADLQTNEIGPNMKWLKLVDKWEAEYNMIGNDGTLLYVQTNASADKEKVVTVDIANEDSIVFNDLIPEDKEAKLNDATIVQDKIVVVYSRNVKDEVYIYNKDGRREKRLAEDFVGSISVYGKADESWFFVLMTGFTTPGIVVKYDFTNLDEDQRWKVYRTTKVKGLDPNDFVAEQVWYQSKDNTKIPMFIVRDKSVKQDGTAPVIQYGYGGFSIPINPSFSPAILTFIKAYGAIYAIANIRGGGEFGEEWHEAGIRDKKVNVFDDFIAAAQYLTREKWAASGKIAINGASNGGLLIAACLNRAPPGTFGAGVAEVGVLDMLKFADFTIGSPPFETAMAGIADWPTTGKAWTSDYGDPHDSTDFDFIYPISPLQNVPDQEFPPTILLTADHDDRVVPLHSFKHAATLQHKHASNPHPLLLRVDLKAGHGAGKSTEKRVIEASEKWGFVAQSLGLKWREDLLPSPEKSVL